MVSLFKSGAAPSRLSQSGPSNIRGKISGPIPFPNPNDDEEFPFRNPGTGIATPLDSRTPDLPPARDSVANSFRVKRSNDPHQTSSTGTMHSTSPPRRTQRPSSPRDSSMSTNTAPSTAREDSDLPSRKKSTLRTALVKLFGKKRKQDAQHHGELEGDTNQFPSISAHHRSILSPRLRSHDEEEHKRSASLPITEFDRALRSHSIGPNDMSAIETARSSLQVDLGNYSRQRAVTTSAHMSLLLRARDPVEFTGLSPRPASTHGRANRLMHTHSDDPGEIGKAITSDGVGQHLSNPSHWRRSRSLSGLRDLIDDRLETRRRSDEIRYWRESYNPGLASPLSSNLTDGDDTGMTSIDAPPQTADSGEVAKSPLQPFNFGALSSPTVGGGEGEAAEIAAAAAAAADGLDGHVSSMRITEVASVSTRVGSLEARVQCLERSVNQLCTIVPEFRQNSSSARPHTAHSTAAVGRHPAAAAAGHTSPTQSPTSPRPSDFTRQSFDEELTFVGSLRSGDQQPPLPQSNLAALTATTNALPNHMTMDDYTMLMTLLHTERSERQHLAAQLRRLEKQFALFTGAGSRQVVTDVIAPPIKHYEDAPMTGKSFGDRSVFEHDDDDDDEDARNRMSKSEIDDDASTYSQDFATPREERPAGISHNTGAFGEKLRDDQAMKGRKAARTLSLSQMSPLHTI